MTASALSLFDFAAMQVAAPVPSPVATALPSIPQTRTLAATWPERARDNLAAIRLARTLLAEQRPPTAAEGETLLRYVGWGATDLAQSVFPVGDSAVRPAYREIAAELQALTTDDERRAMARSTQYAHYTPDALRAAIWTTVEQLGFTGGLVLEPGCGNGLFIASAPASLAGGITVTGIEVDPTTASIARALFPQHDIRTENFANVKLPADYDLVIGNPPYSATTVSGEGRCGKLGLRLHDYFIARSLELLAPGGLLAVVVSHGTMDKTSEAGRRYFADLANLIGAVRLPAFTMMKEAGTHVVVDLLFLRRRREDEPSNAEAWLALDSVLPASGGSPIAINRYFSMHPNLVLGAHDWTSSAMGPVYTCTHPKAAEVEAEIPAALTAMLALTGAAPEVRPADAGATAAPGAGAPESAGVPTAAACPETPGPMAERPTAGSERLADAHLFAQTLFGHPTSPGNDNALFALPNTPSASNQKTERTSLTLGLSRDERQMDADAYTLKEGSYCLSASNELRQYVNGRAEVVLVKSGRSTGGIFPKAERTIRAFIAIRNALRAVIRAQQTDGDYASPQARLSKAYRSFVAEFGPINLQRVSYLVDKETGEETPVVRRPNLAPLLEDPDCWLVASIEQYDQDTQKGEPGPIFTQRVIHAPVTPELTCAEDALAHVLDRYGRVDVDAIAEALAIDRTEAIAQLGDLIYRVPGDADIWQTADEYLSGSVRVKLRVAREAAAANPDFKRNVAALENAQPKDLTPSDITARLGAPWLPVDVITLFIAEMMDIEDVKIYHTPELAAWNVPKERFQGRPSATSQWGTHRRHAGELLSDALNNRVPQIFDTEYRDGKDVRVFNALETEAAKDKLRAIQEAFATWVWRDSERAERLTTIYNSNYNDLVPREFDGSHMRLPNCVSHVIPFPHQKRGAWRIITSGKTYLAHSMGAGKTITLAIAIMEQRRLGLITKPMLAVPGHCLAQFSREFLQLYPTANILVADETNFAKDKRDRFIARATTGDWDCIIITHSAFKLIPSPTAFERAMIDRLLEELESLLERTAKDDRMSRKRIEQRKEALEMRLTSLKGRKDDMVTIAEMGVDQIIIDEAQEFRKLSFTTNSGNIRGIDPNGSQRAWDLYVKSRYLESDGSRRALILASGTPITNTLGEMFTIQRYMAEDALYERQIHEFDAWAATFGECATELELQAGETYKPVTRFCQFINVPELVALFRSFADVVQRKDLRHLVDLPQIETGGRQILTGEPTRSFKEYQRVLAERIHEIQTRGGKPQPGDDILLSVITDGRHAAIDTRLVRPHLPNEPENKLNVMIRKVHEIWEATSANVYHDSAGRPDPIPGAIQMIFSDLGTENALAKRGFSAYLWIREELVRLGVPREQIAFMQHFKRSSEKQELFNNVNSGRIRILLGSSQTMGTGVNCQKRLIALHHLDAPWMPSEIEQREGRAERQGNQNPIIGLYAYATPGSMDATMWAGNERKAKFIGMALSGDRSIRRLEDVAETASSFALAKAIASGNPLLMQKAGLDAEIARFSRLRSAHIDDQHTLRGTIRNARAMIADCERAVVSLTSDSDQATETRGDLFRMTVHGEHYRERRDAGAYLLAFINRHPHDSGGIVVGELAGFPIRGRMRKSNYSNDWRAEFGVELTDRVIWTDEIGDQGPLGVISRLENVVHRLPKLIEETRQQLMKAQRQLRDAEPRLDRPFEHEAELSKKIDELQAVEAQLIAESNALEEERARERGEAAKASTASGNNADESDAPTEATANDVESAA